MSAPEFDPIRRTPADREHYVLMHWQRYMFYRILGLRPTEIMMLPRSYGKRSVIDLLRRIYPDIEVK